MTIYLYNNTSENNKLDKSLSNSEEVTGALREKTSVLNPSFNIYVPYVPTYNYAYIPDFKRYYFITNITFERNNLYRFDLSVDVLMSYKEQIRQLEGVIGRNEFEYNLYLPDNRYNSYAYSRIQTLEFPQGFLNDCEYIITVAGAVGVTEPTSSDTPTETNETTETSDIPTTEGVNDNGV